MSTYKIVRHFQRTNRKQVIERGLTEAQAQEHCSNINTSSSTCWSTSALERTKRSGPWFDGYTEE